MKHKHDLTAERLRDVFSYCPETGIFTRKATGNQVGTVTRGYLVAKIDGQTYLLHRLAFLYMTGSLPNAVGDHIDGIKNNNSWANLRDVSVSVNGQNRRTPGVRNKTGFLGVSAAHKSRGGKPFLAYIKVNGKNKPIGSFDSPEEAGAAYIAAKRVHHVGCTL